MDNATDPETSRTQDGTGTGSSHPVADLLPPPGSVTMFTTSWCGYCAQLKGALTRDGLSFTEVDIEANPSRVEFVENVNAGNRTVPTVLFPDGTTATNPSLAEVRERIAG